MIILRPFIILMCLSSICFSQDTLFVNDTLPSHLGCGKITTIECRLDTITKGNYDLNKVEIKGDCIDLYISYGCGCRRSNFELITDGRIILTNPPQVYMVLKHITNNLCEKLCNKKVSFDISPYKEMAKDGGVIFLIQGTTSYTLIYKI